MRSRPTRVLLAAIAAWTVGAGAAMGATVSGSVTHLSDGSPIAGAIVTAAGPSQLPASVTTGPDGSFAIPVAGAGTVSVAARADGFAAQSNGGVAPGGSVAFALAPSTFTSLPAYGGGVQTVVPDRTSGIFYAVASLGPEVYRTVDYGGSWQPVTMSFDDPAAGLRSSNSWNFISASSVSGEIAFAASGVPNVSFSTDYGVTWKTVAGDLIHVIRDNPPLHLYWGHARAGAPNVLIAAAHLPDGSWGVWRADMSAAAPTFVREPGDPFGSGAVIAFADSENGSFVGRVSASGELSFATLAPTGPVTFGPSEATGLPAPPQMLRLGGAREAASPPDGALAVGGSTPPSAQMLTKAAGASSFTGGSASAPTTLAGCGFTIDPTTGDPGASSGSVAPTTSGVEGSGTAGDCWLQKGGTGALNVTAWPPGLQPYVSRDRLAFDAAWGRGNFVAFSGRTKLARVDAAGVPVVEVLGVQAAGSTDPGSGGLIANGIRNVAATDTAYGPGGAAELAVSADDFAFASKDGGTTMHRAVAFGPWRTFSNAWWRGAAGEWLVFGHAFSCDTMLSAQLDWDGARILPQPNVAGSACANLGGAVQEVASLQGVPGTDTVFIGTGVEFSGVSTPGHVLRARLVPGSPPSLTDVVSFDPFLGGASLYLPVAQAYCPAAAADPRMRDVLFVASRAFAPNVNAGSLVRIAGATTATPAVTQVASIPHGTHQSGLDDVRADCATGIVYVGGAAADPAHPFERAGLYKSVDGGQNFTMVALPPPAAELTAGRVTAIGLDPANPGDVTITTDTTGTMLHSTDGGVTWTMVNDPVVSRPAWVNDLEFVPGGVAGPASLSANPFTRAGTAGLFARVHAAAPAGDALVGTVSGAFTADVAAARGLMAVSGTNAGVASAPVQVTNLASDDDPSQVAAAGTVGASTVFRRANGLATALADGPSWWTPESVPGTRVGDLTPAAATDGRGRLHVAFARTGRSPGVYVITRSAKGTWSAPRRVSRQAGDLRPAIAAAGTTVHVTFLRTRGRTRGVYHAVLSGGRWRTAARVRGTSSVDAAAVLGGPALHVRSGVLHLAFARSGPKGGIYYAQRRGSRWGALSRLTSKRGDTQPALTIDGRGVRHIVFRRPGRAGGLFELRGRTTWSSRRVPGTTSRDADPVVSATGQRLLLAFARPGGTRPGVYYDQVGPTGRWLASPRRWSGSRLDRDPSIRSTSAIGVTIAFERG